MYIVSKKKDYYDSVKRYGIDKSIIYIRETKEEDNFTKINFPINFNRYYVDHLNNNKDKTSTRLLNCWDFHRIESFIIGFCGILYVGLQIKIINKDDEKTKQFILYNENSIKNFISFKDSDTPNKYSTIYQYFEHRKKYNEIKNDELFLKYKVPVFVYDFGTDISGDILGHDLKVYLNPILNNYEFYRVFNSYQAHQQISMYIGNVLTKPEEPKQIDDKYRMSQHGFNEYSFKQESPGKKKESRLTNKIKKRDGKSIKSK